MFECVSYCYANHVRALIFIRFRPEEASAPRHALKIPGFFFITRSLPLTGCGVSLYFLEQHTCERMDYTAVLKFFLG